MRFYLRAIAYFRDDLPLIVSSLVLIALSTMAQTIQPLIGKVFFDSVLPSGGPVGWVDRAFFRISDWFGIGRSDLSRGILLLAVLAVVLRVAQELLSMGQRLLNANIGYNGLIRVRCDLFRKLQQLSIGYHKSQPQGDAIYRLSYDTSGFQTILNVLIGNVLVSGVTLIFMTCIMVGMNWQLTLVTLSVAPLLLWTTKLFAEPLKKRWLEAKEVDTRLTTEIQRSVASIGLVQAFGREADEFQRFHSSSVESKRANIRQAWQDSWYWLIVGTIFGVGNAIIFGYGGWKVIHHSLTAGDLYVFLIYVNQVYAPLQAMSGSGASIQSGVAGVERVFEVLDRDPVIKDAPDAVHLPRKARTLAFQGVDFEYRAGDPVLRQVNVTISPGQMVAFVGSSGVGKTTLLNLLPRFYDPTSGAIKLDDIDIRKVKVKDLRAHVALVLQDNLILPTTVAENISYGRPEATEAQIEHAAKLAGAASFIEKLPQGYETVVSESGGNLSGGQRQRIGIARALLTEAPIMVFDEPTSALDPHHEAMITKTLRDLRRQRTIVVVSHRLSTVIDCDQIFVMDEGRIAERGTHSELIAKRGLYAAMAREQLRIEEPTTAEWYDRPTADLMTGRNQKLRIIVGGLVGQYPMGGVAWDYFHYVLGLDQLGHDVYYHEDTWVWPFDPIVQYPVEKADYTVKFFEDFFAEHAPHLKSKWHYVLCKEKHFGMSGEEFAEVARTADIFLNVSGTCFIPDELGSQCVKVFLDTDPGYNQIMLSEKFAWSQNVERWCRSVAEHDRHLTYAENIYGEDCRIPHAGFDWRPTRCVVALTEWETVRETPAPVDAAMTTIMTWDWFRGKLSYGGIEYFAKGAEFEKFMDLPRRVKTPLTVALNGLKAPLPRLTANGWDLEDAGTVTLTPARYQAFIAQSAGEWSAAKNVYVATRSGWFSCRTACYLASGRPAVVQETGWSKFIPAGEGVVAFNDIDEAVAGIEAVVAEPERHRKAAYELAREYLAPDRVLPGMIDEIHAGKLETRSPRSTSSGPKAKLESNSKTE